MHCERCLKGAELEQLEPVGPFQEKMCSECREVFAAAAAVHEGAAGVIDAVNEAWISMRRHYSAAELEQLERPRPPSSSAPAPVIDGAHAFGNHMVEWRD